MSLNKTLVIAALALWTSVGLTGFALAAEGDRGLVLKVSGTTEPQLRAFQLLELPLEFSTDPGAELEVSVFRTCSVVTITGEGRGRIADETEFAGPGKATTAKGSCAADLEIGGGPQVTGGVTLRAVSPGNATVGSRPVRITPRPTIAVVSRLANAGFQLVIEKLDGSVRIRIPLDADVLSWPPTGPALPQGRYRMFPALEADAIAERPADSGVIEVEVADAPDASGVLTVRGAQE